MSDRREDIEKLVMLALFEAASDSFFGQRAMRVLHLRSDIDKKRKQLEASDPRLAQKLKKISNYLVETERLLGDLLDQDNADSDYIPMRKKTV